LKHSVDSYSYIMCDIYFNKGFNFARLVPVGLFGHVFYDGVV